MVYDIFVIELYANTGEVGRFDHLALQWFELSICNTTISKKYFSTGPKCLVFLISH